MIIAKSEETLVKELPEELYNDWCQDYEDQLITWFRSALKSHLLYTISISRPELKDADENNVGRDWSIAADNFNEAVEEFDANLRRNLD